MSELVSQLVSKKRKHTKPVPVETNVVPLQVKAKQAPTSVQVSIDTQDRQVGLPLITTT